MQRLRLPCRTALVATLVLTASGCALLGGQTGETADTSAKPHCPLRSTALDSATKFPDTPLELVEQYRALPSSKAVASLDTWAELGIVGEETENALEIELNAPTSAQANDCGLVLISLEGNVALGSSRLLLSDAQLAVAERETRLKGVVTTPSGKRLQLDATGSDAGWTGDLADEASKGKPIPFAP